MAEIHWANSVSGSFTNASDWSGGIVPGANDDAILDAAGITPYTVTYSVTRDTYSNLGSVQTAANASLALAGVHDGYDAFNVTNGTGGGLNAGIISASGGDTLVISGPIDNTGTIEATTILTYYTHVPIGGLWLGATNTTLTGGGEIMLQGEVHGTTRQPCTLTNVDNTIIGGGTIDVPLINEAAGVIDVTGNNQLVIDTGQSTFVNAGLLEVTGTGSVQFTYDEEVIDNTGGEILAGNGTTVDFLNYNSVIGGTLRSEGTGVIATYEATLEGLASPIEIQGTIDSSSWLQVIGTIDNLGLIDSSGDVAVERGNATLSGGGHVSLSQDGLSSIYGSGAPQLINLDNTISGAGQIGALGTGANWLVTLTNESKGVIDATGATNPLVFYTAGVGTVFNSGLIEATGAAGITIDQDTIDGAGGGTVRAANGSIVRLQTAEIIGGVLQTAGTGLFKIVDSGSLLDGTTSIVNNEGVVNFLSNTSLTVQGAIDNSGTFNLASGSASQLVVGPTGVTLSGVGAVTLSDTGKDIITGETPSSTLTNLANTISGAGQLGAGSMGLVNGAVGVIDGDGSVALILDTGANTSLNAGLIEGTGSRGPIIQDSSTTNTGLIEAKGSGGLIIRDTTINGSGGGVIQAGNASDVRLQGADLIGGTLKSTGTGVIWTFNGGPNLLDGTVASVDNQAKVVVLSGTALTIQGAIFNANQFTLASSGLATTLAVGSSGATLSGGGKVVLNNNAANIVTGASSAATLTNVDNVITGAGDLGDGSLTLINDAKGVIAGSEAVALIIDTGANTIVNAGVILARGAGGAIIDSAVSNSGILESDGGTLTVDGGVTGIGSGMIYGGALDFTSSFTQNVVFQKTTGVLELAQSQNYTGTITGFSKTGGTSLDLGDIGFVSSTEATFSGTASGGVLTVTDGTHTAHINLRGNYLASTFIASSNGDGGTIVVDPTGGLGTAHRFIAAAASLGGSAGEAIHTPDSHSIRQPVLANPRLVTA